MSKQISKIRLGFSTGTTYKYLTVGEALRTFLQQDIDVAELCYVRHDRLQREELPVDMLKGFRYLSLHAPNDITYGDSKESEEVVQNIQKLHSVRPFDLVLFHPYEGMDLDFFKQLPFPVAFENMDHTMPFGRTVDDLKKVFDNTIFYMVLDMNHMYTNDHTMQLGKDLYNNFKDRIAQIHLSGFEKIHEPLFKTKQKQIIDAIPDKLLPLIVESTMKPQEIKKERKYIMDNI